nr:glycine receptor subunit beta-like [Procambarus clarkii]
MAIVGYLTLFFVKDNFEVRVMTSLTTLLVLATISNQVASSLPKSSSFKLVDVWLLFCIFSNFLIIVFHIIIDLLLQPPENSHPTEGKIILVSDKKHPGGDLISHRRTFPSSSSPQSVGGRLGNKMQPKERGHSLLTSLWRWWRPQLTVMGAEKFARYSVAAIFCIFNVCYWLMAYTID